MQSKEKILEEKDALFRGKVLRTHFGIKEKNKSTQNAYAVLSLEIRRLFPRKLLRSNALGCLIMHVFTKREFL